MGLWCALHGESALTAGLHHVAARVVFSEAVAGLSAHLVKSMKPFSDFPYLKQTFTIGERWNVPTARLNNLLKAGIIDQAQVDKFAKELAVGSHLELIQRKEGFKGFNQTTVSDIITRTDPRAEKH